MILISTDDADKDTNDIDDADVDDTDDIDDAAVDDINDADDADDIYI